MPGRSRGVGAAFPGWVLPAAAVQVGSAGVALGAPAQSTAAQVWAVVALLVG